MISIQTYLYNQTVDVQILDSGIFAVRNRAVYVRPIKLYQGIDNPVVVKIKNQDQKAMDLTGFAVEAAIQDPINATTMESYALAWRDITQGYGNFVIPRATMDLLDQRFYKITFKIINLEANTERPMYTDDNYGVPLDVEVLPAYYSTSAMVNNNLTEYTIDAGAIE
jgi:hypothetical protein